MLKHNRFLLFGFSLVLIAHAFQANSMEPFKTSSNPDELFSKDAVHVIYVDAYNCPDCDEYKMSGLRKFKKTKLASEVYFTTIKTKRYQDTDRDEDWPNHLQWIRNVTNVKKGAPRFVIMSGRTVVDNIYGNRGWRVKAIPLLTRLVNEKQ